MKIHEYQSKALFQEFGIPTPDGDVAHTVKEGLKIAEKLLQDCPRVFVKAQVHAGGRGKAGGIRAVESLTEAEEALQAILGMRLVNRQTGPEGKLVRRVMVVKGCPKIVREMYASVVIDRQREQPVIMACASGGMDIEELAVREPEKIIKVHVHPLVGLQQYQARGLAAKLGLKGPSLAMGARIFLNMYRLFIGVDASQVEINPLAVTCSGDLMALDAKINFDESALFRHPEIERLRDFDEETPLEVEASRHGLNYIKLDGSIGCMVNGAGLAMATMDLIKLYGASPANFLDVGGGASEDSITEAFKILLADADVKVVLVSIFGGIVRCDRVARGIITAVQRVKLDRPLVVRLNGTNAAEGLALLKESGLSLSTATTLEEAAELVIARLSGGVK